MESTNNTESSNSSCSNTDIPPKLQNLFHAIGRAPIPFYCFGKCEEPPTLNVGIERLIAASINARRSSDDNRSFHQFLLAKQAAELGIETTFPCISNAVRLVSKNLLQGRSATAVLEAICIQSQSSSLTTHQNTLTNNGHIALIYVTATGDWKNADNESGFIIKRRNELFRGDVYGSGSFASCYPSELMVLNAPESNEDSYRVTLVYSVFVEEPMEESRHGVSSSPNTYKLQWISQPQSSLSTLNPDVGEIIIRYLEASDMIHLSETCKQFKGIAKVEEIITKLIIECRDELYIYQYANNGADSFDLAIPLQWGYFTYNDHKNNRCENHWLFGLDYVLYQSFKRSFSQWDYTCRKALIRCVNGKLGNKNIQIVQAATEWELNYEDIEEPIDLIFPCGKKWQLEAWNAILHISDYFQRTYDDEWEAYILWPFFFTRFLIGKHYFRGILNRLVPYSGFEIENEPGHSVYLYRSSCLVIRNRKTPQELQVVERGIKNEEIWIAPAWIED